MVAATALKLRVTAVSMVWVVFATGPLAKSAKACAACPRLSFKAVLPGSDMFSIRIKLHQAVEFGAAQWRGLLPAAARQQGAPFGQRQGPENIRRQAQRS
jgi:hypothetical protein